MLRELTAPEGCAVALLLGLLCTAPAFAQRVGVPGAKDQSMIRFDTAKATIRPESTATLAAMAEALRSDPALRLEIQGHTDNVGAKAANLALSQARAEAVRDYLIKNFAVAPDRLTATGVGDAKPVADNSTERGRAQNRRVEVVKLATKAPALQPPGERPERASPLERAGAKPAVQEWTGRVTAGLMAIGGETTGIVLVAGREQLELQPADEAMRRRLEQLDGKTITVRGALETRQGVEVGTRRIVHVTEIVER